MDNQKPETGRRFFDWMRTTGLLRPEESWVGGVFAGISAKVGWDAALVRGLGVVAFIIFFSPAALLYGLAWILVPNREGRIHAQEAVRGNYTSGFVGGSILTVLGALNVFTPISVAGPLAVLLNIVILGAVGWLVYVVVKNHRRDSASATTGDYGTGRHPKGSSAAGSGGSMGKAGAGDSTGTRSDGKPAWYPKEQVTTTPGPAPGSSTSTRRHDAAYSGSASTGPASIGPASMRAPKAPSGRFEHSPRERAERRRRRQVSWGLALLALPMIAGLAWLGGGFGLSGVTVALVATAGLVVILGLAHFTAALRGRPGTPGLLALSTTVMLLLFAGQTVSGFGSGANHVFGNYDTSDTQVQSAFSNTTVDLRDLAAVDGADPAVWDAQVNQAFSNTSVIVPDDARVLISNGQALSNLEIATQNDDRSQSGISGEDLVIGPADSENEIRLDLNSAFGNTTIYDSTTYDQEAGEQR
ncbi:PspC domain-containing protein [Nesterenkonia sp. Act20]|uniref:PspC domain-containing protein n=1 Tax=Nesterenkonia sp. Act20 TaxID=1483432 RepID=UPI001C48E157|nr:PspC domain-containing protein [Nesterenkonia sp. Act20]